MNLAFTKKLGWRLVSEKQNLWARVVARKYIRGEVSIHKLLQKPTTSNLWKGIASKSSILNKGVRKRVRNGGDTLLWRDIWVG